MWSERSSGAGGRRGSRSVTVAAWLIVALLGVIVGMLIDRPVDAWSPPAFAQQPMLGARGIFAFPLQMTAKTYGVCMVDVDASTVWFYEYMPLSGRIRLAASRSWLFDRYLEEYNNVEGLTPADVGRLVAKQRSQRQRLDTSGADAMLADPLGGAK